MMRLALPSLKKLAVILLGVFVLALNGYSQAPGYMGKKLTVGYGFYFHPALGNIYSNYSDKSFNTLHEFFLEYATANRFMVGASVRIFKYTNNNIENVDAYQSFSVPAYNQAESNPQGTYLINGTNIMMYGKAFKKGYLAPWGKYFVFGVCFTSYKTSYDPDEMKVLFTSYNSGSSISDQLYFSDFGPTTQKYKGVDLFLGNGNTRVLVNRIVIDYGYTINLIAMLKAISPLVLYPEALDPDNYIEDTSKKRVAGVNRFNLFIKLGYLF